MTIGGEQDAREGEPAPSRRARARKPRQSNARRRHPDSMGGSGSQLRADPGSIVTVSAQAGTVAAPEPAGDPILARLQCLSSEPPLLSADDATFADQLEAELDAEGGPPGAEAAANLVHALRAWMQERADVVESAQAELMARVERTERAAAEAMRSASRASSFGRTIAADARHGARRRGQRASSTLTPLCTARSLQHELATVGAQLCAVLERRVRRSRRPGSALTLLAQLLQPAADVRGCSRKCAAPPHRSGSLIAARERLSPARPARPARLCSLRRGVTAASTAAASGVRRAVWSGGATFETGPPSGLQPAPHAAGAHACARRRRSGPGFRARGTAAAHSAEQARAVRRYGCGVGGRRGTVGHAKLAGLSLLLSGCWKRAAYAPRALSFRRCHRIPVGAGREPRAPAARQPHRPALPLSLSLQRGSAARRAVHPAQPVPAQRAGRGSDAVPQRR